MLLSNGATCKEFGYNELPSNSHMYKSIRHSNRSTLVRNVIFTPANRSHPAKPVQDADLGLEQNKSIVVSLTGYQIVHYIDTSHELIILLYDVRQSDIDCNVGSSGVTSHVIHWLSCEMVRR
ncbi:hypothetical protein T05_14589 [Trichinella murrelli]|uniref:Uncharacterized protein n=1 Tax=Trichinella murrelli TaxID=144512 RepID=A0A0V0T861_9BILA|nr:hypothetical protein T05_14589 [Trichinella murrelli]